jgi:hypothetical protein
METNRLFVGLANVVVIVLGGSTEARAIETYVVPGLSIRNGDWIAVDALGVGLLGSTAQWLRGLHPPDLEECPRHIVACQVAPAM